MDYTNGSKKVLSDKINQQESSSLNSQQDSHYCQCLNGSSDDRKSEKSKNGSKEDSNNDDTTNVNIKEKIVLEPFIHQVGGHNVFLTYNSNLLCKVFNPEEYLFYKHMSSSFTDFIPKFHGLANVHRRVDTEGVICYVGSCINEGDIDSSLISYREVKSEQDRWEENCIKRTKSIEKVIRQKRCHPWYIEARKRFDLKWEKYNYDEKIFMMLENVTTKYEKPCVLDVKIGFRAHGDNTEYDKMLRKIQRCETTTTIKCGIRLCGLQTYHVKTDSYTFLNKYNGRKLDMEELKDKLKEYFFDGEFYRYELIEPFIKRLKSLMETLEKLPSLRLFATSVLLVYEGNLTHEQSQKLSFGEIENFLDLRLIDFAQSSFEMPQNTLLIGVREMTSNESPPTVKHEGPDENFVIGLSNLVDIFQDILRNYSDSK